MSPAEAAPAPRPPESPPGPLLTDGPFLAGPGPARKNLWLLGLWLPTLALTWAFQQKAGASVWTWAAILGGGLAGALAGAPSGRRARSALDLDWLVTLALGPFMLSPLSPAAGLALGLAGGLLSVRPGLARLKAAPGLLALGLVPAAALALEAGARLAPAFADWPPALTWGRPAWPFIFAAGAAGLAVRRRRRFRHLAWPALAAGLSLTAGRAWPAAVWLPYFELARLAALALPLFLILPALARSGRELAWLLALGLPFLWLPPPPTGLFALNHSLPPLAAALIPWAGLLRLRRRQKAGPDPAAGPPETSAARPYLKCGAPSPPSAGWAGPASCRLAAAHDGGPRRCPYGCLGLGDCRAACPTGALVPGADGLPGINRRLCRGCGRCAAACPRGLWEMADRPGRAFIPCASRAALKESAALCPVSCLGCGRCRKACPAGAVGRAGRAGAPRVDRTVCAAAGPDCRAACAAACPRGIIRKPASPAGELSLKN